MSPKITVFMAAFNSADYISDSIQSILDQTFHDFELLIVNDGSTDRTIEVVETFRDDRIRLIHNDKNRGLTYTRNVAMTAARAEFIAILDSDDIAAKNRLELQYDFFQQNPTYALCGGHGTIINKKGQAIENDALTVPVGADKIKMTLLFENTFINSSVMYKTSVLKELGGYQDYAPAEDYELFVRMAEKYPVGNLEEILVKYRIHENNISELKVEVAKLKLKEIKRNQLSYLNIPDHLHMGDLLFSILMCDYQHYKIADYRELFQLLKLANRKLEKYPVSDFEKMLFEKWFDVIYLKKAKMNAFPLLFDKDLFKWSYVNGRQLRKIFKLTVKGIGRFSA